MQFMSEARTEAPPAPASHADSRRHWVRIGPPKKWEAIDVGELWKNRELMGLLVWRDVKVRYKQTVLGAAWAILQPLLMMLIFTVCFGRIAHIDSNIQHYALFVYLGLTPWYFFANSVNAAGNSVVVSERLVSKVYFPRLCVPFATVGASVFDFFIAFLLVVGMLIWFRVMPNWQIIFLPVIVANLILMALGMGTLLAALNVQYRDFRLAVPFLMQVWMYATTTIYMKPVDTPGAASNLKAILALNPMAGLISNFRACCMGADGGPINYMSLLYSGTLAVVMFLVGCLCFRKMEKSFADVI